MPRDRKRHVKGHTERSRDWVDGFTLRFSQEQPFGQRAEQGALSHPVGFNLNISFLNQFESAELVRQPSWAVIIPFWKLLCPSLWSVTPGCQRCFPQCMMRGTQEVNS